VTQGQCARRAHGVSGVVGDGEVTLSYTASSSGTAVTSYTATSSPEASPARAIGGGTSITGERAERWDALYVHRHRHKFRGHERPFRRQRRGDAHGGSPVAAPTTVPGRPPT